ncbi:hypothetical protein ACVWXU_006652 [Streptomyces sp. TE33382]
MSGGEAVPATVRDAGGPLQGYPGAGCGRRSRCRRSRGRRCRCRRSRGRRCRLRHGGCRLPLRHRGCRLRRRLHHVRRSGRLLFRHQRLAALQDSVRQADRPGVPRHQVHPGADLGGERVQPVMVLGRTHVHQGHDDVPLAGTQLVEHANGVEHGVAGRELVVDQDQRCGGACGAGARQQCPVLRQQQVRRGVRVGLLESARPGHSRHRAPRRVQIRGGPEAVRDGVAEAGGRFRVAEDDRAAGLGVTQERPYPLAQLDPGAVHHRGPLRHMLAQHVRHEQMRPFGVAAQGEAQHLRELPVADQFDSQSLGNPAARPHHVHGLFSRRALAHRCTLSPPARRPAVPRNRRLPSPHRRPRPAAVSARPRPGAASLRSSCSCTRNAVHPRRRSPAAGCPPRH